MASPSRLLTGVLLAAVRVVRLPLDLLFLSFDFLRYTAWAVRQNPFDRQGLLRDPYPPCLSRAKHGPGGRKEFRCALMRKYGNPFLLRFLFPGIILAPTPEGRTVWTWRTECIRSPTTIPRYLAVAALLVVVWCGAGLGALACLVPGALHGHGAGLIHRRPTSAPKPPVVAVAPSSAVREAAADQLLAAKSWPEARQAYASILQDDPSNPAARVGKGQAALELGYIEEARTCFDAVLANSPRHPGALLGSATVCARTGKTAQALAALKLLLAASPDNQRAKALQAECLRRLGRFDEALTAALAALQSAPEDRDAVLTAARVCLQKRDFEQATTLFAKAVQLDPQAVDAYVERADILRRQGQLSAWEAELTALLPQFPDEPTLVAALVDAQVQQGNTTKALDLCKAVTGRHPDYHRLREIQAALLLDSGRRDETYLAATALLHDQPGNRLAHLQLATLFLQGGVPSLAEEHCRIIIAQGGENQDVYRLLAQACTEKGDWPQAITQFETLLRSNPDDQALRVSLARSQANAGNRAKAIEILEQACAKQPQTARTVAELGTQQFLAGKRSEALASFRRAHELDPNDWSIQNNLAVLLSREGKEMDQALGLARQAFEQAPGNSSVADTLGWIHVLRGEYEQAAPFLAFAFGSSGNAPQILYHYAELKNHLGDRDAALRLVRKALAPASDFPDAAAAKQLLRQLEPSPAKAP